MAQAPVAVIGGGIVGLSCAYYLQRAGKSVVVIDRSAPDSESCSTGNAGMIVPSHFIPLAAPGMVQMGLRMMRDRRSPFGFKLPPTPEQVMWSVHFMRHCTKAHVRKSESILRDLNLFSRAEYLAMAEALGIGYQLETRGLLAICKTQAALDHEAEVARRANEIGVEARVLDQQALASADEAVTIDAVGAVHFLRDAHLTPHALIATLRRHLEGAGAAFMDRADVIDFHTSDSMVQAIRTSQGDLEPGEVVLAAGAWSGKLGKKLRLDLPMMAGKGYSMTLPNPPEMPKLCSLLMEARVAITPMRHGLRVAGTMEIGPPDDSINQNRVEGIIESVPKYFPKFKASDLAGHPIWKGMRPCSPDGLPFVGRVRRFRNLTVATGHSMMGLSLGPITGKLVSQVVTNQPPDLPLDLLSPDRYS